jgi:hypothetical protein
MDDIASAPEPIAPGRARPYPVDPWAVREVEIDPSRIARAEAIFAPGLDRFGPRDNLEEGRHKAWIDGPQRRDASLRPGRAPR